MGKNIVHCGGAGFGQVVKICNNMVAGIITLATAEAFVMGEKLGVDRQTLYDVLSTSSASSFILSKMCPMPGPVPGSASSNGFKPGFSGKLMLKDLRLSQSAAQMRRNTDAARGRRDRRIRHAHRQWISATST